MIEIGLLAFCGYITAGIVFGYVVCAILSMSRLSEDDTAISYWMQYAFIARSIMSQDQLDKVDEKMEGKDEE